MSVAERLAEVRSRVEHAERASGRPPGSVRLLAVSKRHSESAIREAYAAGQRAFGENYAQELVAKSNGLGDLPGLEWHFIGHLQTNKAKLVARHAHAVHTLDSVVLAGELGKRAGQAGRVIPVLVEVNVGGEAQKAGAAASEIQEVMDAVRSQPYLELRGLMTMPPAGDLAVARRVFETVATLRTLHGGDAVLPELSMGMTADLEVAIACGATLVRVGTGVFGER
ncbi:MAG: YggS family pyridoxal phosphate-dependent enzyme [Myxococcota bacterium]|nr:YggS family pyridoxal phosphate-dependent enzyme [Myxococcota bacterium]